MTKLVFYSIPDGIITDTETNAIPRKGDLVYIDGTSYSAKHIAWQIIDKKAAVIVHLEKKLHQTSSPYQHVKEMDELFERLRHRL